MFGTKTADDQASAQEVFDHQGPLKVLQLSIKPEKAEEQLTPWLAGGYVLKSTEGVMTGGTLLFVLAFLERKPR